MILTTRRKVQGIGLLSLASLVCATQQALGQFSFNFGASGGSVVASMANQTCGGAGGGGGMGGAMGGGGRCDGTTFTQEVVTIGGATYYHDIIGDGTGEFGIEYYMRTSGDCWFGCATARVTGGMGGAMGMMGGGSTPFSSSFGSATEDGAPLAAQNNGTGAPDRVAVRQFNRTAEMTQEFLKATETQKPKITQAVNSSGVTVNFSIDMTNSNYRTSSTPGTIALTEAITGLNFPTPGANPTTGLPFPNSGSFDIKNLGTTANSIITGGRYTYAAGPNDGGSMGTYAYFADAFDVYRVNWQSYCVPAQNPASGCTNYPSVRGGMGGAGGGGMGGGAAAPAPGGGGAAPGGGGMGGGM